MSMPQIAEVTSLAADSETTPCDAVTGDVVILGINFRSKPFTSKPLTSKPLTSKRRERIYDPDKVWSGEHTIMDYTEI